jgi:ATP-binding cassette, subfamily C, bacterial CydC
MKALGYFLPMLARNRLGFAVALGLSVLAMAAGVGLLGLSGWFITAAALSTAGALFNIIGPSAGVRALSLLRILARYGERYTGHETTLKLVSQTRVWLFGRLLGQESAAAAPVSALGRADAVSRLVADLDMVDNVFLVALGPIVTAVLTALAMGIGFALLLPAVAPAFVAIYLVAAVGVPVWLLRRTRDAAQAIVAASARLRHALLEGLDGHRDLALYGRVAQISDGAGSASAALAAARKAIGQSGAAAAFAVNLLAAAALVTVLVAALAAHGAGAIDGPLLVGLLLAVLASFEATQALVRSTTRLSASIAAAARVMLLAEAPTEPAMPEALALPFWGRLSLRNLSFGYPGAPPVLHGLSLDIEQGERIAITGPSGSGKSTLAALLVRLHRPDEGTISLGGVDLARVTSEELRRHIALMLQDAVPFAATVRDNLRMAEGAGRAALDDDALWQVLDQVGLAAEIRAAGGLDAMVGEAGLSLSSGQARRLILARTLLTKAEIVVLDEPTAGLDHAAELAFWQALQAGCTGRTVIVITHGHDPEAFNRIMELRGGQLFFADKEANLPGQTRLRTNAKGTVLSLEPG